MRGFTYLDTARYIQVSFGMHHQNTVSHREWEWGWCMLYFCWPQILRTDCHTKTIGSTLWSPRQLKWIDISSYPDKRNRERNTLMIRKVFYIYEYEEAPFFYTSSDVFLSWFCQTRRFEITIVILLQIFTLAYWVNSKLLIFYSHWHVCWHLLKQSFCSELSPSSQYFPSSLGRGLVQVLVRMRWFPAQIPAAQPLHADQPDQPPFTFEKE